MNNNNDIQIEEEKMMAELHELHKHLNSFPNIKKNYDFFLDMKLLELWQLEEELDSCEEYCENLRKKIENQEEKISNIEKEISETNSKEEIKEKTALLSKERTILKGFKISEEFYSHSWDYSDRCIVPFFKSKKLSKHILTLKHFREEKSKKEKSFSKEISSSFSEFFTFSNLLGRFLNMTIGSAITALMLAFINRVWFFKFLNQPSFIKKNDNNKETNK